MFASESYHPPMRITDLLNPVRSSDAGALSDVLHNHPPSMAADAHSRTHTHILPSFSALDDGPHVQELQARLGPERNRDHGMWDFAPNARTSQAQAQMLALQNGSQIGAQEESNERARMADAQEQAHAQYSLRAASWESARARNGFALAQLSPVHGSRENGITSPASSQQERRIAGGAMSPLASSGANGSRPAVLQLASVSTPANVQTPSPVSGFAASHFAAPPAMLASPHGPYGRQQQQELSPATLGPHQYAYHPHLAARSHLVPFTAPPPAQSPVLLVPMAPGDNGNVSMVASSSSDFQSSDRASARVLARGMGETSSAHAHSSYVLQLHPTQQLQQEGGQKKRSHAEANVDEEGGSSLTSAPRSSASSLSSLSSLSSVAPVADIADEDAGDDVPRVKKTRGKSKPASPLESKKSNPMKGKASKKRTGSEESVNASVTNQTDSSQKGKENEKMEVNYHYPFQNGQLPLLDPHITMQLGYGVSVMPIQEGVPIIRAVGFPYPIQMHSLGPGMPVALAAAQNQHQANLFPELQFARCMSARYRSDAFPRCVSCTRRWAGDTCRFQNIRILLRDTNKNLVAVGFQSLLAKCEGTQLVYPEKWNISLKKSHVDRIMGTVADALLPHLQKEQAHQKLGNVVKRQRETDVRATCDTCMTSLFSSSWMCRQCGREACEECYQTICRLTAEPSSTSIGSGKERGNAVSGSTQRSIRERHAQTNPFFLSCNRKAEHGVHTFNPVTRFVQSELDDAVKEMVRLVKGEGPEMDIDENVEGKRDGDGAGGVETNGTRGGSPREHSMDVDTLQSPSSPRGILERQTNERSKERLSKAASDSGKTTPAISLTPSIYDDGVCSLVKNPVPPSTFSSSGSLGDLPPTSSADLKPPTWPIPYYTATNLSEPVFAAQWARGTPLVVTGLLNRFTLRWTPEYFIKTHGSQPCIILECQTDANKKVTVGEFFGCFGKYEGRSECWKLKDWPPSSDFKTVFPELYDDFSRAVPIPNYTRRDGAMNIASHFPINTIAPDLGPKMYNAYASNEDKGTKGSTRLHMDMADAVNIMLHSELTPGNAPGCAVWDIFRAEDSAHLRSFFKRHFKGQYQNDPIHAQTFYLDKDLREQLFEEYGVRSFRIYQRPGEAVFIPAGCAHQVCNLADSIKVACDFVSPENIERCETLTREFRAQNQSLVWKEDVLQLRSMMWFAWLSCWKQQAKWRDNGEEKEASAVSGSRNGAQGGESSADTSNGS